MLQSKCFGEKIHQWPECSLAGEGSSRVCVLHLGYLGAQLNGNIFFFKRQCVSVGFGSWLCVEGNWDIGLCVITAGERAILTQSWLLKKSEKECCFIPIIALQEFCVWEWVSVRRRKRASNFRETQQDSMTAVMLPYPCKHAQQHFICAVVVEI